MLSNDTSLISKETQYFIAEATKTLDLVDNQLCDEEGDTLWAGCGSVEKSGRLCEVCSLVMLLPSSIVGIDSKARH